MRILAELIVLLPLAVVASSCASDDLERDALRAPGASIPPREDRRDVLPVTPATSWPERIADAITRVYGEPGVGMASQDPDAVVAYVHWVPADGHVVYVTSGVYRSRFPHELVMRIRFEDPPTDERLWQVAPSWPTAVLAELGRVEAGSPHPFAPGNHITNVDIEGVDAPYRHFAFVRDPVLPELRGPGEHPLVFVQVVPLTETQRRAIDAVPTGQRIGVLSEWAARDRLLLVDARSQALTPMRTP